SCRLADEAGYGNLHHVLSPLVASGEAAFVSPAAGASAAFASRKAPGRGASFGRLRLTASRIWIQPPFTPGTAPSTRISPFSTSVRTTRRFWVVTRSTPIWPAIFLFLKVLPGSWRPPVEPSERCEIETPCEARKPPKFQ